MLEIIGTNKNSVGIKPVQLRDAFGGIFQLKNSGQLDFTKRRYNGLLWVARNVVNISDSFTVRRNNLYFYDSRLADGLSF